MDSLDIKIHCADAGNFALIVGNPLGEALMRPSRVVVCLVLGQDSTQMRLAKDRHAAGELAARVPMRRSQVAFIQERVKFDPRSRIRNREILRIAHRG